MKTHIKTKSKNKQHKLDIEVLKVSPPQNDAPPHKQLLLYISPFWTSSIPLIKILNLSTWELDCTCWVLVVYSSGVCGDAVSVVEPWLEEVAWGKDSLLGTLEKWLLLAWRGTMDIGWRRTNIFSSFGGWTLLSTMIFMRMLQKGRHVRATIHAAVFPIVWKIWAQISIETSVMWSHKNCWGHIFM